MYDFKIRKTIPEYFDQDYHQRNIKRKNSLKVCTCTWQKYIGNQAV